MDKPREGFAEVTGGQVWYQIVGEGQKLPLIIIHGGPGYPHDYLEPLIGLSENRSVLFYDQLGCGRSERPENPTLWTVERFVDELDCIIRAAGFSDYHLLGHSWGTIVAVEHALRRRVGLRSLVLSSPCLSIPLWKSDTSKLLSRLPEQLQKAVREAEQREDYADYRYAQAVEEYNRNFVCSLSPKPEAVLRADSQAGASAYLAMWGPSEFTLRGSLRDYDITGRLGEVDVPTLYTCGALDEAQPATTRRYARLTPLAETVVLKKSSHLGHWEERDKYLNEVSRFLSRVEEDTFQRKSWVSFFTRGFAGR